MKKPHSFFRIAAAFIFFCVVAVSAFGRVPFIPNQPTWVQNLDLNLGLDLSGGLHLEYSLDLSRVEESQIQDAVNAVQAVVERRINAFGVGEPLIQIAQRGLEKYLIVEIPGISDIEEAKNVITRTPFLEFREERSEQEIEEFFAPLNVVTQETAAATLERIIAGGEIFESVQAEINPETVPPEESEEERELNYVKRGALVGAPEIERVLFDEGLSEGEIFGEIVESDLGYHVVQRGSERLDEGGELEIAIELITLVKRSVRTDGAGALYKKTELTGEFLKGAQVTYPHVGGVSRPEVTVSFNSEGARLFEELTERNVGKTIAIAVDDQVVSAPVVQEVLYGGTAQITGNFTIDEAKNLAGRLNEGALPVPITLESQQSIEASLGEEALRVSVVAGAFGLLFVMIYMVFYYRFFGVVAALAIAIYATMLIAIIKLSSLLPSNFTITLTLSGIAGMILSIGMAVDANILIFERIKEELKRGRRLKHAVHEGFERAWSAIRDGNFSTIITSLILIIIGTGFVKGFAVILMIGVLLSMFTAVVLVRFAIDAMCGAWLEKNLWLLGNVKSKEESKR